MEFFDKLGKKASEAYKMTADKTGKIAKETKIKFKIGELRTQVNDVYEEIGKKVYEKHVLEGEISIENEIEEYCTKLDVLSDEIDSLLKQCLELKDKKQCPKCYSEIEKEMKFCPNCGYKQIEENVRETEILDDLEVSEVEEESETEDEIIKDYLQEDLEDSKQNEQENQDEKEKTNLEKTVAIESDIDIEENNKEQEE
mgnify:CR=1 FL=1